MQELDDKLRAAEEEKQAIINQSRSVLTPMRSNKLMCLLLVCICCSGFMGSGMASPRRYFFLVYHSGNLVRVLLPRLWFSIGPRSFLTGSCPITALGPNFPVKFFLTFTCLGLCRLIAGAFLLTSHPLALRFTASRFSVALKLDVTATHKWHWSYLPRRYFSFKYAFLSGAFL